MPEAQVSGMGVGGGGNKVAWDCISSILKNWVFLKLLIFKNIEYFILQLFRMTMPDVTI